MRKSVRYICMLWMLLISMSLAAAGVTRVTGKVVEAGTGEVLPFTQIYFEGTQIGTTSDMNGKFEIQNERDLITICFRMLGYKTKVMTVKPGRTTNLFVVLEPSTMELEDVIVTPKKSREKYRRKGNPAVDLIKNVIANKDRNRVGHGDTYKVQSYEKLVMALEPFDYNLDKNAFWRDFKFLENYVDTMAFEDGVLVIDSGHVHIDSLQIGEDTTIVNIDSIVIVRNEEVADTNKTTILTMSLRETMAEEYVQTSPRKERKVIYAKRWEGLDELLDNGTMSSNLQAMFQPMDIFANDINLMLNRFVSPLSSSLAVSFYHYYIMDTILIEGTKCVDLAFVPVNSESFGFTGHLYIAADSTYALKRYKINVPPHINLNWLSHMSVRETFQQLPDGKWASEEVNTHVRFAVRKKSKHNIYARQTRHFSNYEVGVPIPDSLFYMAGDEVTLKDAKKVPDTAWDTMRPIELTQKELLVRNLQSELMSVPKFHALVNTVNILIQEFIPTSANADSSKWDFGPIFNSFCYNEQEGCRLRIGGMTTANLNPHWYTYVYGAYGFTDQRFKGSVTALYSFNKKEYFPYESLRHYIALQLSYDLEELGQTYRVLDRDNIFMSIKFNYSPKPMQYIGRIRLKYEKEWANQFSILTWFDFMNNQPNGSLGAGNPQWAAPNAARSPLTLRYMKRLEDGSYIERPFYHDAQWTFQLRYSPGGYIYNDRQGIESPFNLWKDAPVFRFTNEMGYILEDKYFYNRIQLSAEKRIWLSAFGHLDVTGDVGYIATNSKVPFTKLFIPTSNTSILMDPKAFNLMQPMEFLMDRYVSVHMTYYLKGWIINRIPGLNKLKLRGILSYHMLAGYLGDRNNPFKTDGLYDLPYSYTVSMGDAAVPVQARTDFSDGKYSYMPYMEITAGIENIFKLIRIEYVRRLTHLTAPGGQKLGPWQRNGIRITLRVAM